MEVVVVVLSETNTDKREEAAVPSCRRPVTTNNDRIQDQSFMRQSVIHSPRMLTLVFYVLRKIIIILRTVMKVLSLPWVGFVHRIQPLLGDNREHVT